MGRGRPRTTDPNMEVKNVNFRAPREFVKRLKLYCVRHDLSIQDFIIEAIKEKMKTKH